MHEAYLGQKNCGTRWRLQLPAHSSRHQRLMRATQHTAPMIAIMLFEACTMWPLLLSLHQTNTLACTVGQSRDIVRYTRYDTDQEGFTGDVKVWILVTSRQRERLLMEREGRRGEIDGIAEVWRRSAR